MGSLWFATGRNRVLAPVEAQSDVAAGQRMDLTQESSRSLTIAFTLATIKAFPMTHHVECVALLTKAGSDPR